MDQMKIIRVYGDKERTLGVILWNGIPFSVSLERGWNNNSRGISCIPTGTYEAVRCNKSADYGFKDSPRFGDTFTVENVPGRSKILFHKGNINDDTHGCILIGEQYGSLGGELAILASKAGFDEFKRLAADIDRFAVEIIDVA